MKSIGIVGGLSPEVTAKFYLKLAELSRNHNSYYPHVIIDSVPLGFSLEDEIILQGRQQLLLLPLLSESVKRLQHTDMIVIPCNTAHIFMEKLRKGSKVPVISIVEEVIKHLKNKGCKTAGLLATCSTIQSRVYKDKEIRFLPPSKTEQGILSEIIIKIIRNTLTPGDKLILSGIADSLKQDCDAIVLACTDLQNAMKGDYIDSFEIAVNAVFEKLTG